MDWGKWSNNALFFCGANGLNTRATTIITTGVSGGSIKPSPKMDLNCISLNRDDNTVGPVRLENVELLENSNYNLFSLFTSKVVMLKGSMFLTFDIVIKTIKGALFCAHLKRKEAAITGANDELTKSMSTKLTDSSVTLTKRQRSQWHCAWDGISALAK